jgi:hypothetical protein
MHILAMMTFFESALFVSNSNREINDMKKAFLLKKEAITWINQVV